MHKELQKNSSEISWMKNSKHYYVPWFGTQSLFC